MSTGYAYGRYGLESHVYDNFKHGLYDKEIFDIPKHDLPLYINDEKPMTRAITKWRLHHDI